MRRVTGPVSPLVRIRIRERRHKSTTPAMPAVVAALIAPCCFNLLVRIRRPSAGLMVFVVRWVGRPATLSEKRTRRAPPARRPRTAIRADSFAARSNGVRRRPRASSPTHLAPVRPSQRTTTAAREPRRIARPTTTADGAGKRSRSYEPPRLHLELPTPGWAPQQARSNEGGRAFG